MSFSDVGKGGGSKRSVRSPTASQQQQQFPATIPEGSSFRGSSSDSLRQVSDGILQYQRNLGILERIAGQVGTKSDGPVLQQQYKVQVDVLKQLGQKLERELKQEEEQLESLPRERVAKQRASLLKLSRDYRRVEASFKNVQLETRKKRARLEQERIQAEQRQQRDAGEDGHHGGDQDGNVDLQQELQEQDRLHQEIMRERQEEILNINRGMHQVNEIYKDLAHIVGSQQDQVDSIETQMEDSKINAEKGLEHVTKANEKASATNCVIS